ncbi:nonribosomal peptide synthetase gloA [Physcia stellaris]|nr:nonribosomal peptide synthetase gloA [Physcia stellaris]
MWSEVLDMPAEEISASDDFFELGGSSLTAIQLVSVARARGVTITMDGLLRHSRLSSLAENSVDTQTLNDNAPTEQPIPLPAGFEDLVASRFPSLKFEKIYPVNFAQMATLLQGPSWPEAYHVHLIIEVHGPSDADLLQKACQDLLDHYATLRSIFHVEGENCVQLVAHPQQIPASLQVFDSLDEARDFWNRHEADFLDRPLTHFGFVRAEPDVSLISIGLHHVQMDDWMTSQVLLDLASAYLRHPMRPQTSFIAYAQEVDRRDNDEAASHWRALLQGSKLTGLSNVQDTPANGANGSDRTLFRRIHRTSSLRRTTFGDLLHAAWGLAMAQVSKCLDIVFITVTSGRSIAFKGVETVMGPCPNVIPVRASFKPGQRYIEVLEAYKGQNIASSAYETTPFTSVCTKSTDWPFPPTVGAMVNHTQVRGNIFEKHPVNDSTGMTWRPLPSVEQKGRCDAVHVYLLSKLEGESVGLSLQFNPDVVTEERAEQLMECLCLNIDRICHGPEDEIDLNGCC